MTLTPTATEHPDHGEHKVSHAKCSRSLHEGEKEEDDFFGDQDSDNDEDNTSSPFGSLGSREIEARQAQLKNVSYLESYDASKEERLQEGFEAGYRESFGLGKRIGMTLGIVNAAEVLGFPSNQEEERETTLAEELNRAVNDALISFDRRPEYKVADTNPIKDLEQRLDNLLLPRTDTAIDST